MIVPHTYGYDATLKSPMSDTDLSAARAPLDVYGYIDRDSDGWREQPDGRPLVLRLACLTDQRTRRLNELWKKCMDSLGVRMRFEPGQFGELIKRSLTGQLMMWGFARTASWPTSPTSPTTTASSPTWPRPACAATGATPSPATGGAMPMSSERGPEGPRNVHNVEDETARFCR
jgi:hypothetical protein